jgi:hypothetical protein
VAESGERGVIAGSGRVRAIKLLSGALRYCEKTSFARKEVCVGETTIVDILYRVDGGERGKINL